MMIFLMPYHLASPPNDLFLGICHVRGTGKRGKSASNDYWDLKSLGVIHRAGSIPALGTNKINHLENPRKQLFSPLWAECN